MNDAAHILVLRFSALGDVAMTVPVVRQLLLKYPGLRLTFVSQPMMAPLFEGIDRLTFVAAHLKGVHAGLKGMYRLHQELGKETHFDGVADLHDVLRTKVLRLLFSVSRNKIATIDKGRAEKAGLTKIRGKQLRPLRSTFLRYADVFQKLGLPVDLEPALPAPAAKPSLANLNALRGEKYRLVGVAPYAKHAEKTYPLERMREVVRVLSATGNIKIFLFGGAAEAQSLDAWAAASPNTISLAGKGSFSTELEYIAALDLMVSMDSANMHLASIFGVRVVSVWGSTHPFAGFYGWGQNPADAVQVALYCRPCSVFGNRKCYRGDLACLRSIEPGTIVQKVLDALPGK